MKRLASCTYNMDKCCVEFHFSDDSIIAIDTIAVENEVEETMCQSSELDWLIYNKPSEYAHIVLEGYLKGTSENRLID